MGSATESNLRQHGGRAQHTMGNAAAAAAMVVVSGPDPKGAKAQQQPFHSTSNGIMSVSASGAHRLSHPLAKICCPYSKLTYRAPCQTCRRGAVSLSGRRRA